MRKELFEYAIEGLKRNKKTTIPAFLVLCISFSFVLFATCLVDSIARTNDEFIVDNYGDWYADILDAGDGDVAWAKKEEKITDYGMSVNYGVVHCVNRPTGIGTVDEKLKRFGRIVLAKGKWPKKKNEVVMEADALCALGYDYTLGQTIQLTVEASISKDDSVIVSKEYKLVGIVKEYSDLWTIAVQGKTYYLNGILLTTDGADTLQKDILSACKDTGYIPVKQLFLQVTEKNRKAIKQKLNRFSTAYNQCILEGMTGKETGTVYIGSIFLITVIAVFFTYSLQLKKQIYSYAVMRCIGMRKAQLARMVMYETVILCLPAIVFGIVIGSSGMAVILRVLIFGGSVPIKLAIDWRLLFVEMLLWFASVILSRLIVFRIAVRAPLIGHMEMHQNQKKAIFLLRQGCILWLCACFGTVIIFTGSGVDTPQEVIKGIRTYPSYRIYSSPDSIKNNSIQNKSENECNFSKADLDYISSVPGIRKVVASSVYRIVYADEAKKEMQAYLIVIDDADWENGFHFHKEGIDLTRFREGNCVFMCFQKEGMNKYDTKLSAVEFSIKKTDEGVIKNVKAEVDKVLTVSKYDISQDSIEFLRPYTLLCSKKFMEKYGVEGYTRVWAYARLSTDNKSTDTTLAEYCKKNGYLFANDREYYYAWNQREVQELVMLYSSGTSIGFILSLLLGCILSLEKEYQNRNYRILRTLGMSRRQWRKKQLQVAVGRGVMALVGGWVGTAIVFIVTRRNLLKLVLWQWGESAVIKMPVAVSTIAIVVVFGVSMIVLQREVD